ncbi:MAG: fibronectin/fibrinogen-binding protein [Ruminococcaceae bacterium]|nr:fibronectin/fibrinogen-binding protein [Oscillospiraceae bacterium]
MAFDAGMLYAVLEEIKKECLGLRVEKVHQPTKDEILLLLRGKRLSVNLGSVCPRISLTQLVKDNPQKPPMLCLLLRKHLLGAILDGVSLIGFDRVARLSFSGTDEMGFPAKRLLYAELMGKYSNLILTDEKNKIIAVAKPIDFADSDIRQLLPGLVYEAPPVASKADPLALNKEAFLSSFASYPQEKTAVRFLTDTLAGTATVVARELVFRTTGGVDTLLSSVAPDVLFSIVSAHFLALKDGETHPTVMRDAKGTPVAYGYTEYRHREDCTKESFESFSALFDAYFGERDRIERIHSRGADLVRLVSHAESRLVKKLALLRDELASSEKSEEYRQMGDLITAEIYRLKRGTASFVATDYSVDPPAPVTVPLDTRLSPAANAQRYYKLYAKAKTAKEMVAKQIALAEEELAYIASVSAFLTRAETEADLGEIRDELYRAGYGSRMKKYTPMKAVKARPYTFVSPNGYRVLCGKNNLQNELLTFRTAEKGDLWFHAKGVPGSHVILVCGGEEPPEEDYTFAAAVAAHHSAATGDLVAVDYTRVKNVKKPPASRPGYVTYKTNYTAFVRPLAAEETKGNETW